MVTGIVRVVVVADSEEEAWRLAAAQTLGPFRRKPWHDSSETLLLLLSHLRRDAGGPPQPQPEVVALPPLGPHPPRDPVPGR